MVATWRSIENMLNVNNKTNENNIMKTSSTTFRALVLGLILVYGQAFAETDNAIQADSQNTQSDNIEKTQSSSAQDDVLEKIDESAPQATVTQSAEEVVDTHSRDLELWEYTKTRPTISNIEKYLQQFPYGKFADDARVNLEKLEAKARERVAEDKALDAYRKKRKKNGLVLELASNFDEFKPYIRSMLNSCGYQLIEKHRFAKRVYPTINISGSQFSGQSDHEYSVTLNLSIVLTSKTREIQAREKMLSYRTSKVDIHNALHAAFEDIGAQMKNSGFCY